MRILFLGNNWLGSQCLRWLGQESETIAGLVVHPSDKRSYFDEIMGSAQLPVPRVFDGARLREAETLDAIRKCAADIAVSVMFGYILDAQFINLFPRGVINLHPSYLPYNGGSFPNVWSIVDGTQAGVTLHYIDEGVDSGDIIAQQKVVVDPNDTGATLYHKLENAGLDLFQSTWPKVREGSVVRKAQEGGGTYHRKRDVEQIDHIELDRTYTARQLIDVLRARTFPPHPGAYFEHEGRRFYLRLEVFERDAA